MSMQELEALRARIRSDDYAVDTYAVAAAILSRVLAPGCPPDDVGDPRRRFGEGAPHATG